VNSETLATRLHKLAAGARAARAAWDDSRRARDTVIREADAAEMPLREIARWTDMAPSAVLDILARP
jgi:hypothetical protein